MIKLLKEGGYKLFETSGQTKVLVLDDDAYAWINALNIGEILITSQSFHKIDHILSIGKYRLYEVEDEAKITDLEHLELFVGEGIWQGYLLPNGMPDLKNKRRRTIPTNELITKFSKHLSNLSA